MFRVMIVCVCSMRTPEPASRSCSSPAPGWTPGCGSSRFHTWLTTAFVALRTIGEDTAAPMRRGTATTTTRSPTISAHCSITWISARSFSYRTVRYLTRYGAARVGKIAIISGTTPCLMKRDDNPDGIDIELVKTDLAARTADRPKWFAENAAGFFGVDLPGIRISPEFTEFTIRQCLDCSARATVQFFLTGFTADFREQLRAIDVPALVVHGDRDLQAPLELCGRRTARLLPRATLQVYESAAHGLFVTHADRLNADLLEFAKAPQTLAPASVTT
jgi:hypothetical protein